MIHTKKMVILLGLLFVSGSMNISARQFKCGTPKHIEKVVMPFGDIDTLNGEEREALVKKSKRLVVALLRAIADRLEEENAKSDNKFFDAVAKAIENEMQCHNAKAWIKSLLSKHFDMDLDEEAGDISTLLEFGTDHLIGQLPQFIKTHGVKGLVIGKSDNHKDEL